ncbi:RNA pseudouridine synthase 1-like [Phoenix dactylifera]|uniref:RNA pseudouridine synthase 1-like n=1 Tax=Phoenix dactylifera TaxID=42345 RepID=A0A8B7CXJ7_PHODC|nr:RNA pseudouridine synthase 1-like [Phoenix dactylifera]
MPFRPSSQFPSLLASKTLRHLFPLPSFAVSAARSPSMAAAPTGGTGEDSLPAGTLGGGYPTPLSPPYPAESKVVELRRAMTAAARSGSFELTAGEIVYEDEWLAIANKPSGVYCEAVLSSFPSLRGFATVQSELHLANRLDRDTSGLMVITKSHKVAGKLVKAFTNHEVKKTYLALCIGYAPSWKKITISSGHGRSKFGAWRVYSTSDVGRTLPGGSMVKHMVTSFEVLSINGQGKFREPTEPEAHEAESIIVQEKGIERGRNDDMKADEILVRAYPQSGRTHQIRLHCQYLGIPIKGDVKYGGVLEWKGISCDAHTLHAESLSFRHPVTGLPVQFQPTLPLWASEICGSMLQDS